MPTLYVLQGPDKGRTFRVHDGRYIIGRKSADIGLSDTTVSRKHAELRHDQDGWQLVDLGSSNGTYLNGERLGERRRLNHGDQIKVGATIFAFGGSTVVGQPGEASEDDLIGAPQTAGFGEASILSSLPYNDDSIILAAPETAEAVRAWNMMYHIAEAVGSVASIKDFLERMTDILMAHLPIERLYILTRAEQVESMSPAVIRYRNQQRDENDRIGISRTIVRHVMDNRTGLLCANATADERFHGDAKAASIERLGLRSVICVPIIAHDNVYGAIHVDSDMARYTYSHEQLRLITAVGRIAGLAVENARLVEQRMHNERLAATGETVAYLSHHIRNILQGLRSGADVVDLGIQKKTLEHVEAGWKIVQHNFDRIFQLVSNMLTFSKNRKPRWEMTQINTVLEDALVLAEGIARERGVTVEHEFGEVPAVPMDPEGIHQAVFNLLTNAIAASPRYEGKVRLSSSYNGEQDCISVAVADNGPGVPGDQINRIFQPFHSSKGQGGTGLGLAAAKKIVDEHAGAIKVDPGEDGGSIFRLCLPTRPRRTDSEKTHGPAA